MRKMNPEGVREDFDKALDDVHDFYKTVKADLATDKDETLLVQNTILTAATLWESFVNDMFIAYINRVPLSSRSTYRRLSRHRALLSKMSSPIIS